MCFGFFKVFQAFFLHVLRYQFETWYIHAVGSVTCHIWVSFQSRHFDLLYSQKKGQSHLSASMALKIIYRPQIWYTHLYCECLDPTDFRHGWAIFGPLADKNTWKGVLLELPASEKFSGLFCTCFEISVWNLAYTSSGWCHTSNLSFIQILTLWPTLQPKIGQSQLSTFMALKII